MPSRKGIVNKNKAFLINKLQDMYGKDFDPIMRAAEQADVLHAAVADVKDEFKIGALKASIDAWLKIGEYVTPKLRSTEINMSEDTIDTIKSIAKSMDSAEAQELYQLSLKAKEATLER